MHLQPQEPPGPVIPHLLTNANISRQAFSPPTSEAPDDLPLSYDSAFSYDRMSSHESILSRPISRISSAASMDSDGDSDAGARAISSMRLDSPHEDRHGLPAVVHHSMPPSMPPSDAVLIPPRVDWLFSDITDRLPIEQPLSEDRVKVAVKVDKDASDTAWISRGSIRAWCTQCGEDARHKMLVLRYRCAKVTCDACTLQAKYIYCPVRSRVYYGTSGGHALCAGGGRGRRGISLQLKRVIEAMVAQGKNPSTIAVDLKTSLGEESPSLRQVQNYVFRLKKKKEHSTHKGRDVERAPSQGLPPPVMEGEDASQPDGLRRCAPPESTPDDM